jgi:hypothetical protein
VRIDYQLEERTVKFSWLRKEFFLADCDGDLDIFCTRDGSKVAKIPKDSGITIETMKLEFQR